MHNLVSIDVTRDFVCELQMLVTFTSDVFLAKTAPALAPRTASRCQFSVPIYLAQVISTFRGPAEGQPSIA